MNETISEWPRHRKMHTPLRRRVACGDYHPAVWKHVFAQFAVEHQLVAPGLRHLRRRGQFIEKENAFPCGGQEFGWHPFGLVCFDSGQPPQIDRIELHGANIKELKGEIVRDLRDDLRFADAARAPDMQRHTFADQRMKRLIQLGWFHLDSPQAEYWFRREEWVVGQPFWNALDYHAGRFGA
jgi:hypothetical protein